MKIIFCLAMEFVKFECYYKLKIEKQTYFHCTSSLSKTSNRDLQKGARNLNSTRQCPSYRFHICTLCNHIPKEGTFSS